jgi:hypothetical protein
MKPSHAGDEDRRPSSDPAAAPSEHETPNRQRHPNARRLIANRSAVEEAEARKRAEVAAALLEAGAIHDTTDLIQERVEKERHA